MDKETYEQMMEAMRFGDFAIADIVEVLVESCYRQQCQIDELKAQVTNLRRWNSAREWNDVAGQDCS